MGDFSHPKQSKVDANRLPRGSRGKTMKSWVLKKIPTNEERKNRIFRVSKVFRVFKEATNYPTTQLPQLSSFSRLTPLQ